MKCYIQTDGRTDRQITFLKSPHTSCLVPVKGRTFNPTPLVHKELNGSGEITQ